jgi:hypothetical protein
MNACLPEKYSKRSKAKIDIKKASRITHNCPENSVFSQLKILYIMYFVEPQVVDLKNSQVSVTRIKFNITDETNLTTLLQPV